MIRINLLPGATKQVRASSGGSQGWIIGYMAATVVLVIVLGIVYMGKSQTLQDQVAANSALQGEITDLESQSTNLEAIQAELDQSRQLESVVSDLQRARYGPTSVLMEISRILSPGVGPTIDQEFLREQRERDPTYGPNMTWETQRLWVTEFEEEERACTIRGVGKTNQDVAEFFQRLTMSRYFSRVELIKTEGVEDSQTSLPVIEFELTCEVIY